VRSSLTGFLAAILLIPVLTACAGDDAGDEEKLDTVIADPDEFGPGSDAGTVADGLDTPWGVAFLPDGSALVSQRGNPRLLRVRGGEDQAEVGTVGDRAIGVLGLAVPPADLTDGEVTVFAFVVAGDGNRVVRMTYADGRLGAPQTVLDGIPAAEGHQGGRLAAGPDGALYVGTGADDRRAQDRRSLAGKILRIGLDGSVPQDNPFPGSPVWSLGHSSVDGLAFDARGQLWATESGQRRYDELNRIEAGRNYGWPVVEGQSADKRFARAYFRQPRREGSQSSFAVSGSLGPGGLAIAGDVAYVPALDGESLWELSLTDGGTSGSVSLGSRFGRLRTAVLTPEDRLWLTTSNREPGGEPAADDDRILEVPLP
jgi:glucose/arabinose dehydrogenase